MSVPPKDASADAAEHRLILRFLDIWEQAAGDRPMPRLKDFSGDLLEPFKPFSVVIDLQDGYDTPIIRHVGSAITALMGDDFRGRRTDDVPRRTILSRVTDHFFEVLANRAPVGFEADFTDDAGTNIPYRGVLTPLSEDGEHINFVVAAINWRGAPPWEPRAHAGSLATNLAALRDRVAGSGRARNELYELLAEVYGFYLDARQTEADYKALLRDNGIRAQARAPFTAALKLAFGAGYDKTRLTEYGAAMSYAHRQSFDQDAFLAALLDTPGGLKALVRAERSARGNGKSRGDHSKTAVTTLDELSPRAVVEDWRDAAGEGEDYVVLLARHKAGDGQNLVVLDALPAEAHDLKRFTRERSRH